MPTIPDINVISGWVDLLAEAGLAGGTRVRVQNKGAGDCVLNYNASPDANSNDGIKLIASEAGSAIIEGEANIWCKSLNGQTIINVEAI